MGKVQLSESMKRLLADPKARKQVNSAFDTRQGSSKIKGDFGNYVIERSPSPPPAASPTPKIRKTK